MDALTTVRNRWRAEYYVNGEKVVKYQSLSYKLAGGLRYQKLAEQNYWKRDELNRIKYGNNADITYDQWLVARNSQLEHIYKQQQKLIDYKYNYEN